MMMILQPLCTVCSYHQYWRRCRASTIPAQAVHPMCSKQVMQQAAVISTPTLS